MSRQGQLPPRCPVQKKPVVHPTQDSGYSLSPAGSRINQSSEQPVWLDDLLSDSDMNRSGDALRRSVSDSVVLMEQLMDSLPSLNLVNDEEGSSASEACGGIESACVYGPNSPRIRKGSDFSERSIVSAFSEYVSQNSLHYLEDNGNQTAHVSSTEGSSGPISTSNADTKVAKRHPGQRSRVRKLQYIAELERTVSFLQNVESELSMKVASLLHKRATLSLENNQLKRQMAILKQEKLVMEGQYQSLKKEAERLRPGLANVPCGNARKTLGGSAARSEVNWRTLDMTKLNLN